MKIACIIGLLFPVMLWGDFFTAEIRAADFRPTSSHMRKTYQQNILDLEVETSLMYCQSSALWANLNYMRQDTHQQTSHPAHSQSSHKRHSQSSEGESLQTSPEESSSGKTTLQLYPISVGYKTLYPLGSCFVAYYGAGVSYSYVKIKNKGYSSKEHFNKTAWGTVVKAGLMYNICAQLFANLFVDYYYTKVTIDEHKHNLGGFRAGLGLGLSF